MSDSVYAHQLFKCVKPSCNFICYTTNQLQEHMLDKHSTLVVPSYTVNGVGRKEDEDESTRSAGESIH
jgi:hypothetical protein